MAKRSPPTTELVAQAGVVANTLAVLATMLHRKLDSEAVELSEARRQSNVVAGEAARLASLVSGAAPLADLADDTAAAAKLATRADALLRATKPDRAEAQSAVAELSEAVWSINTRIAIAAKTLRAT